MFILANSAGEIGMPAAIAALCGNAPALDAVEAGIRPVERDPAVRSVGVGGWPNLLGQVELDAAIMDGRTLAAGAVAALRGYIHPISVARQVMARTPHVLLAGEGAARFAAEIAAEAGPTLTAEAEAEWRAWLAAYVPAAELARWSDVALAPWTWLTADPERAGGTVTYLAQDAAGDLAAGVSTCGWAMKYPGRLGDSPIIGAGSYADNAFGAAACTGHGELAIRAGTARSIVLYMQTGMTVAEACRAAADDLRRLVRPFPSAITLHAVDRSGLPFVLALGDEPAMSVYWWWAEGMAQAEQRQATCEDW